MAQQTSQTTTINTQTTPIIVEQSTPQQTKSLTDILGGFFKKDPVSTEIEKQGVRAFGDDTYVPTEQGQKCTSTNLFCWEKFTDCQLLWKDTCAQWNDVDKKWANEITKFKEQNILSLGDIRIRSVLMAFSAAVLYKTISINTTGLLRKSRNLGISFLLTGYMFVPELFNPFLKKPKITDIV